MIEILKNEIIDDVMSSNHRQYLVGDLKLPQDLNYLRDNQVEVGITDYREFRCEKPHYHLKVTEYQMMLSGKAKYVDLDTGDEIEVNKGDFFIIRPNTKYIQKSPAGTRIIFFKCPGGNDKVLIDMTDEMLRWAKSWEEEWIKSNN